MARQRPGAIHLASALAGLALVLAAAAPSQGTGAAPDATDPDAAFDSTAPPPLVLRVEDVPTGPAGPAAKPLAPMLTMPSAPAKASPAATAGATPGGPDSPAAAKLREALALNEAPEPTPTAGTALPQREPGLAAAAGQALAALLAVLALVFLGAAAVRRYGRKSPLFAGAHLGTVLGRIHLDRNLCLHLVRIADRVLVVGGSPQGAVLLTEYDATAFDLSAGRAPAGSAADPPPAVPPTDGPAPATTRASTPTRPSGRPHFIDYLRAGARAMVREPGKPPVEEAELETLRGDIERLQAYLREASLREPRE